MITGQNYTSAHSAEECIGSAQAAENVSESKKPSQYKLGRNTERRMREINEEVNPYFVQQHFACLNTDAMTVLLKAMNELAFTKDGLYDDDYESVLAGHATLWAAAQILPAIFELVRRDRWRRTYSIGEILAVRDGQQTRIANQLKRPKVTYIRKRDKLASNPASEFCPDAQALRLAVLTLVNCGWLLCTDHNEFEISPAAIATSYGEYMDHYASEAGMHDRTGRIDSFSIQLSMSPRTIEFLAYLGSTSYMDFWRYMAIVNLFAIIGHEASQTDLLRLYDYHYLFALTPKQARANDNRGYARPDARYWIDRYVQRGWLGHWVKRTPMKRMCGFFGKGGVMRDQVIHDRRIKPDYYETETYWIVNPSVAVYFEFDGTTFYKKIGRYFRKARFLQNPNIDFLGIFRLRHKRHRHYIRWRITHEKVWNWDKYHGPTAAWSKPNSFRNLKAAIFNAIEHIGAALNLVYCNTVLAYMLM